MLSPVAGLVWAVQPAALAVPAYESMNQSGRDCRSRASGCNKLLCRANRNAPGQGVTRPCESLPAAHCIQDGAARLKLHRAVPEIDSLCLARFGRHTSDVLELHQIAPLILKLHPCAIPAKR